MFIKCILLSGIQSVYMLQDIIGLINVVGICVKYVKVPLLLVLVTMEVVAIFIKLLKNDDKI